MPSTNRRRTRPDPLDPDADLDGFSSDELEETVFGPDPERPRSSSRRRSSPRPQARPTKFCHACAETLDARAEMCPHCGVRQPETRSRRRSGANRDRNTAVLLAIASLLLGGVMLHKFYLGSTGAGVLSLLFFWTGIPFVVSLFNLIALSGMSDDEFDDRYR